MPKKADNAFTRALQKFDLDGPDAPLLHPDRPPVREVAPLTVRKVSDKMIVLTMAKAAEYARLPRRDGFRPFVVSHAQKLLGDMLARRFNWDNVVVARCWYQGVEYPSNGQHTCSARLGWTGPNPRVRELVYETDSLEQLIALYNTFDSNMIRPPDKQVRAALSESPAIEGLCDDVITRLTQGIRYWKFEGADYRRLTPAEHAVVVHEEYPKLVNLIGLFLQSLPNVTHIRRLWRRQAVTGAMFATFSVARDPSVTFWTDTLTGTNLILNDPRWHLNQYLANGAVQTPRPHGVRLRRDNSKAPTNVENMYRACLQMWHHWRHGVQVKVLRIPLTRPTAT